MLKNLGQFTGEILRVQEGSEDAWLLLQTLKSLPGQRSRGVCSA